MTVRPGEADYSSAPCRDHQALFLGLIHQAFERRSSVPTAEIAQALAVCRTCPVTMREVCDALGRQGRSRGVWGGRWWTERMRSGRQVSQCADCGERTSRPDYVRCQVCAVTAPRSPRRTA